MTANFQNYIDDVVCTAMRTNCSEPTRAMTVVESEAFREFYEKTLRPWDAVSKDDDLEMQKSIWAIVRAKFDSIVANVEKNIVTNDMKEDKPVILRVQRKNFVMEQKHNGCVTVGRIPLTDIPIDTAKELEARGNYVLGANGSSRLHAIVRKIGSCVVIIDVGSYNGIVCLERRDRKSVV